MAVEISRRELATDPEWARLGRFLGTLKGRGRRTATLDAYDKDWRAMARWYAASTGRSFDLTTVTPLDAVDYLGFLARTCKPATVARRVLFFRTYAAEAYRARELAVEVFKRIQLLWAPKPQPEAPQGLTADEAGAALRNVERGGPPRDRAIVFVILLTGIRVGELAGFDVRDLELSEVGGVLRVRAEIAKGGREREVRLPKEVCDHVREYVAARDDDSPALFVGQRGRMTPSGIRDVVARYAGVPPQRLRHTFAYEYLRSNHNDLVALADILGHASINTTRGYTRRLQDEVAERVPAGYGRGVAVGSAPAARPTPATPAVRPVPSSRGLREVRSLLIERAGLRSPQPRLGGREVVVAPRSPDACRIKGVLFVARQRFVRARFGEAAFADLLSRLSPACRSIAERPVAASWYPFASLVEYDRAIYESFRSRSPQVLTLLGAASAEYGVGTVYRVLDDMELVSFLEGLAHFHGQYQTYGRSEFTRTDRGGRISCYDNPCYSPLYCASAVGFFWEAMARHGARDPRVEERKCHCRGDSVCLYELQWR